jgi:hypothetical protein
MISLASHSLPHLPLPSGIDGGSIGGELHPYMDAWPLKKTAIKRTTQLLKLSIDETPSGICV